jgi:hypothetical protein
MAVALAADIDAIAKSLQTSTNPTKRTARHKASASAAATKSESAN